jgi:hypothetical protein
MMSPHALTCNTRCSTTDVVDQSRLAAWYACQVPRPDHQTKYTECAVLALVLWIALPHRLRAFSFFALLNSIRARAAPSEHSPVISRIG